MAIVNFAIPKTLDKRVKEVMEEKGFASKAEFFRSAAMYFMDVINKPFKSEDDELEFLVKQIEDKVARAYDGKKLPSAREQYKALERV